LLYSHRVRVGSAIIFHHDTEIEASVKRPLLLLVLGVFLLLACDIGEHPLTDPTEMYEKAVVLIQERSFKQAKPLLEQAIGLFKELKKNNQLTEALTFLVQTELELGEFRAALAVSEEAAMLMRKEGDVHGEVRLALLDGDLYVEMQMFDHAIAWYRNASASATAFGDKKAFIEAQLKLASTLKINNDLDEAQHIYKDVLTEAQASNDNLNVVAALSGIGSIYRIQQRYMEAANSLTQALASTDQIRDSLLVARVHIEIGLLHSAQNSVNAALRDFRDAINTLRQAHTGKELETVVLFRLGHLYEQSGKLLESKRYYTEAMELARSQGDRIAENYLSVFLVRCDFGLMTLEQRLQSREKLLQSYEQIAKKFQECRHIAGEGYLYTQIGKESERVGDLFKAQEWYAKAVMLAQNALAAYCNLELHEPYQAALGIYSLHTDWYELLSALLIKMHRQDEALKTLEFARVKKLAAIFQKLDVSLRHPKVKQQTKDVQAQLQKAKLLEVEYTARFTSKQYSSDSKEMKVLHAELESTKQSIRKGSWEIISEYPNYEALVLPGRVEAATLRNYIPNGSLAIEFLPTDDTLYVFALTRSQLVVRASAIHRDSLFQLMAEYRRLLQDPAVYSGEAGEASVASMTRFAILSTQLYELLLRPVDDLLERNLIIVVNREMDGFPFHAIERQDAKGNVKYVIELTSVDYVPSLASLRYRSASFTRTQDVVAFGNPTGKNWSVDYELRDIRSFFKNAHVMVGLEASWDNLKSIKADILQISTEFSQRSTELPLGSIMLSNGLIVEQSTTAPFEKLTELAAVPVMILSNQYGQGLGLSAEHALLLHLNGASDVFFNAWQADRKAAKFFSEYFFTHLANGLAPGDAYRQALLNLIRTREVSQPRSWGQFFHFGIG
jgi:tetratricopeptide (TPR) repeat protein